MTTPVDPSDRFLRKLLAARAEIAGDTVADLTRRGAAADASTTDAAPQSPLYRRAVPTDARTGLAPPPLPVPGLRIASNGVAVLVAADFPDGRVTRETVDAALHAARAAGVMWVAAWPASDADAEVMRALEFVGFDEDRRPPPGGWA